MHDHLHDHPIAARKSARRRFSLAQLGVGARLGIAGVLVVLVWALLLPLVLA